MISASSVLFLLNLLLAKDLILNGFIIYTLQIYILSTIDMHLQFII